MPPIDSMPADCASAGEADAWCRHLATLFRADRPILALVYQAGEAPDPLLASLADAWSRTGMNLAGLVQRAAAAAGSRCNMVVELLPGGRQMAISEDRGAGARGCRLDQGLLIEALAAAEASLDDGTDLLILNRFGKVEAEGGGGRALMAHALDLGVPVLVAVPWRNISAFRAFAGDFAQKITLRALAASVRAGRGPSVPPSAPDRIGA